MAKKNRGKGHNRRVFINRSLATAGGAVILSQAKAWPSWAGEAAHEGVHTRMGQLALDRETGELWQSHVRIDISVEEVETKWGPTKVTRAENAVMVKAMDDKASPVEISGRTDDGLLEPRIDARDGRVCVCWCGYCPETGKWNVYGSYKNGTWTNPAIICSSGEQALHPDVAMDPSTGLAWIVYEDWGDGSIKIRSFDGKTVSNAMVLSETGANYRPRVIVTARQGKHQGRLAVSWDSYRDRQYDIYMRLIEPEGAAGPEMRVSRCARWDSQADVIEDLDGNIWVAWVRASNELSEVSAMRNIHVRFFDGEKWMWPETPDKLYDFKEFQTAYQLGQGADNREELNKARSEQGEELGDGRLTWYQVTWYPELRVDERNRVYVFYREADPIVFPLYSHLIYRVYENNKWSDPQRIRLGRGANILKMMWGHSVAVVGDKIRAIWEQAFNDSPREIAETITRRTRSLKGSLFHARGRHYDETEYPGWQPRTVFENRPEIEIDGKGHILLFGDTHAHSYTSDGADPSDYYYHYARDIARLDYFGLSDHDFRIAGAPGIEAYIAFLPRAFNREDFICFQGYEFTSSAKGHRVVVFEGGDQKPLFPHAQYLKYMGKEPNTNSQLYSFLHRFSVAPDSRVLVTAHNMFSIGNDFSEYDESIEPLYDVTSVHVAAEKTIDEYIKEGTMTEQRSSKFAGILFTASTLISGSAGQRKPEKKWFHSWRQILNDSLPLGAFGTSDTHAVSGVGWITSGTWAERLDRQSLFDSFFARKTIALDNLIRTFDINNTFPFLERRKEKYPVQWMDIRLWLNGRFMGEKVSLSSPPALVAKASGHDASDPVKRIIFVKNGQEIETAVNSSGSQARAEWTDKNFKGEQAYYYVRVEFASGNTGYSSPVFVNY